MRALHRVSIAISNMSRDEVMFAKGFATALGVVAWSLLALHLILRGA